MKHPPLKRFLGLGDEASDAQLLALTPGSRASEGEVRSALQERLRYLDRHPAGKDPEAIAIRTVLIEAALRLARTVVPVKPTVPTQGDLGITDFDRQILSILVGHGGWNPSSRGHLVALAARHQVSPTVFMRIIRGLSDLLHHGDFGALLHPDDSGHHEARLVPPSSSAKPVAKPVAAPVASPDVVPSPQVEASRPARPAARTEVDPVLEARLRRAVDREAQPFFWLILVVLLLGLVILGGVLLWSIGAPGRGGSFEPNVIAADSSVAESTGSNGSVNGVVASEVSAPGSEASSRIPWKSYPAFGRVGPLPDRPAALDPLEWRTELDELTERIFRTSGALDAGQVDAFEDLLVRCGSIWPMLAPNVRYQLVRSTREPLLAASDFVAREQLLGVFDHHGAPMTGFKEPEQLWLASWVQGILGTILDDQNQPRQLRESARRLMEERPRGMSARTFGIEASFDLHASRYLDDLMSRLMESPGQTASGLGLLSEYWLLAQGAILKSAVLESALLDSITFLLLESDSLTPDSDSTRLLARLASEVDWSMESSDPQLILLNLEQWFTNPRISSENLEILTNLILFLNRSKWWNDSMLVGSDADLAHREVILDRITAARPEPSGGLRSNGVPIDARDSARLQELMRLTDSEVRGDLALMRRLLVCSLVSAAAEAFWKDTPEVGRTRLVEAEALWRNPPQPDGRLESAQPVPESDDSMGDPRFMLDGVWSRAWNSAGSNLAERRKVLRELRQFPPSGDIGPKDATTLAEAALKYHPSTRAIAQEIILEHFDSSPNLMIGLLNEFSGRRTRDVHEFLTQLLTEDPLPPRDSTLWPVRVRSALVRHAWLLQRSGLHDIENIAARYASGLVQRLELITDGRIAVRLDEQPEQLLSQYAEFLRTQVRDSVVSTSVPATLAEIDRKTIFHESEAASQLQRVVVELFLIADLSAYLTAALRPELEPELAEHHARLTASVTDCTGVLGQMILLEQAIAHYIALRLEPDEGGVQ